MKPASEWAGETAFTDICESGYGNEWNLDKSALVVLFREIQADATKAAADAVRDAVFPNPRTVREDAVAAIEKLLSVSE